MKMRIWITMVLWIGLLAVLGLSGPRPSAVTEEGQWTLHIQYEHPVQISVKVLGQTQPQRFWYMIISLTNETTEDEVPFYPKCELVTDTFEIIPAGLGEKKGLFELIKAKHRGRYPFLESLDFTDNRIRRGMDNTRDFVIFWPDFDANAKSVQFYLAGLSNETTAINHPVQRDGQGNPLPVYLQKTLQLTYSIGADPHLREDVALRYEGQDWVMR